MKQDKLFKKPDFYSSEVHAVCYLLHELGNGNVMRIGIICVTKSFLFTKLFLIILRIQQQTWLVGYSNNC